MLREAGRDAVCLRIPEMELWLPHFPSIARDYTVLRDEVSFLDPRMLGFFQRWGVDYGPDELERFVQFAQQDTNLALSQGQDDQRVVVNVRRGDFLAPQFVHRYSFNQQGYLRAALGHATALGGPAPRIHVVSDDIPWCREHLRWLGDSAELSFAPEHPTPIEDFTTLATSRRLILTNSTFGYWAAHFSTSIYRDNHQDVVVPWFHDRTRWSGAAYQLDPSWTVVRHISGGWDGPAA